MVDWGETKGIKDEGGVRMASEKRIRVQVVDWPRHDEVVGWLEQTVCMNAVLEYSDDEINREIFRTQA